VDENERDTDADDAPSDGTASAVANAINDTTVIALNEEFRRPTIPNETAVQGASPGNAENGDASNGAEVAGPAISTQGLSAGTGSSTKHGGAAIDPTFAELEQTAAPNGDANSDTSDADMAQSLPVESVESADATTIGELLPKSLSANRPNPPGRFGEQPGATVSGPEVIDDMAAMRGATEAKIESASVDPTLSDLDQSDRDSGTAENAGANDRAAGRLRSDASAVANTLNMAAIANGATTKPESSVSPGDGGPQGEKSIAKVESAGIGAVRLHAHAGMAKRGNRTHGEGEAASVDPARFVGRVAKAFHTAQERGGTLQIRLSPPELGAMRLELTVKDGVMTAALETETAAARRVLLEHLPALRDRLAEQNIRVERFDVDVRREGGGGQTDPRAAQDHHQPHQGHGEPRRRPAAQPSVTETIRQDKPIDRTTSSDRGINLVA
jgi:flagellar hook-length control protein FliK